MGVNKCTALWILDFLTERPQFVCLRSGTDSYLSSTIVTNTGAPQGTVLAPVLFSIYTNDCRGEFDNIPIIKYADDTSIQALISSEKDLTNYKSEIDKFVQWCDDQYLKLNVSKTKEIIFDFRKNQYHNDSELKNEIVERVNHYKYLGIIFDDKLEWQLQSNKVLSNMNQRMYCMRKLYSFHLDEKLLYIFYKSCEMSILEFCRRKPERKGKKKN